jgi:hypothetical protein
MVDKDKVIELIERGQETDFCDFKREFYHTAKKADVIKDILSFANSTMCGDKYIIFNVDDETRQLCNMKIDSLPDVSEINGLLREYCEPYIGIELCCFSYKETNVAYIKISADYFDKPYMVKKDYVREGRTLLQQGQVFVRRNSDNYKANRRDLDEIYESREKRSIQVCKGEIEEREFVINNQVLTFLFENNAKDNFLIEEIKVIFKCFGHCFSACVQDIIDIDSQKMAENDIISNIPFSVEPYTTIQKNLRFGLSSACIEKIQEYINLLCTETVVDDGYIVSSYLLYANAREALDEFQNRILELKRQYQKLVASYSKILVVRRVTMAKRPEPSAIFMNLPQYNRIYECILRWFGKTGYDLINERTMISFTHAPAIYEAYVLIKLITQIKEFGYDLIESKLAAYPKQAGWLYKNQNYNNTFVFSNEDSKITLYYEPVIYDEDRRNINGIELYRNNNISLGRDTDDERKGRYYVPDYIIKYEKDVKIQYLICDAKFSRKTKVQHQIIPDLAYKYLTSISPLSENANVLGLYIFYGLNENNSNIESFYNRKMKDGKTIFPMIEMIPLSEGVLYSDQTKNALEMLRSLIKYNR